MKNIQQKAKYHIHKIQKPDNRKTAYEAVQNYNAFVMGEHNFYRLVTNASQDFAKIAFPISKSLKVRLKENISNKGICSSLIKSVMEKANSLYMSMGSH